MFVSSDLTRLKLNLLKGMPGLYSRLVTRLNVEGLMESDIMDDAKRRRIDGILDYFYSRFMPL
ncbi:MAG: hypothetical protein HQL84_13290 [Magnetococcales bacterium]|nr:hypothetical protein [Magnetococcales bacterium]MBF0151008.1 hypothetical protein [Magnetococcales bacterium]MBF0172706.1 hypothetical protein [Magnetococcales bacterium]MBF0347881.1 hypothetical protein [Magnetococcales bacterium]MBF0629420.1 hypothetical protein [Magnetococcales bacterium]